MSTCPTYNVAAIAAANDSTDEAARLRGLLQAAELEAAGRWAIVMIDARASGHAAVAEVAENMARGHKANAAAAAAIPNVTGEELEPAAAE